MTFTKALYTVSLSSYYTFYLMPEPACRRRAAQIYLFVFSPRMPRAGVFFGGPIGDRIGREYVIWLSILGALPFALAMPHLGLIGGLSAVAAGLVDISSATAAIIVFARD